MRATLVHHHMIPAAPVPWDVAQPYIEFIHIIDATGHDRAMGLPISSTAWSERPLAAYRASDDSICPFHIVLNSAR
jgi:hypothetical protein